MTPPMIAPLPLIAVLVSLVVASPAAADDPAGAAGAKLFELKRGGATVSQEARGTNVVFSVEL